MDRVIVAELQVAIQTLRNATRQTYEEQNMKTTILITIISLASALTISQANAQGNPHLDPAENTVEVARFQGNPHFDAGTITRYVEHYRGNPHEGTAFKIARVARSPANPHGGFEIAPLTVASSR